MFVVGDVPKSLLPQRLLLRLDTCYVVHMHHNMHAYTSVSSINSEPVWIYRRIVPRHHSTPPEYIITHRPEGAWGNLIKQKEEGTDDIARAK